MARSRDGFEECSVPALMGARYVAVASYSPSLALNQDES